MSEHQSSPPEVSPATSVSLSTPPSQQPVNVLMPSNAPASPSVPAWLSPALSGLTLVFVLTAVYNFALWRGGVDANLRTLQDGQVSQEKKLEQISLQLQDLRDRVVTLQARFEAGTAPLHQRPARTKPSGAELRILPQSATPTAMQAAIRGPSANESSNNTQ